jgi:hypothetical protein
MYWGRVSSGFLQRICRQLTGLVGYIRQRRVSNELREAAVM